MRETLKVINQMVKGGVIEKYARPEHLVAIMLDTGRPKDYLRVNMFLEEGAVDRRSLNAVLKRHGLAKKWKDNEYRFKP